MKKTPKKQDGLCIFHIIGAIELKYVHMVFNQPYGQIHKL